MLKIKHSVSLGLLSLILSIPFPTLIHNHLDSYSSKGYIDFLHTHYQGYEANILLTLISAAGIGLLAFAIYVLGEYLTALGSYNKLLDEEPEENFKLKHDTLNSPSN